jgi:hypothetical protein
VDETTEVEKEYKDEDKAINSTLSGAGCQSPKLPREARTISSTQLSCRVLPHMPDRPVYGYLPRNDCSQINLSSLKINAANLASQSSTEVLAWPVNNHVKAKLLSIYFQECSSWCEVTDSTRPFSILWGNLMAGSLVYEAAAVALASVMGIMRKNISDLLATEIHRFGRETLRNLISVHSEGSLLAATILCMYYAARGNMTDLQPAVRDCAELLKANSLNNSPDNVYSGCFWAFARQGREQYLFH